MASEKPKEVTVSIHSQNFPRTVVFNRVGLEKMGAMRIFYFGLVDEEDHVRDSYACAIDELTLDRQKEDLLAYVARAGTSTPAEIVPWKPKASTVNAVHTANIIRAARVNDIGEIRLFNYSLGAALDVQTQGGDSIEGFPIALLRCQDVLQRALFLSIYAD
jgi:hypothetical protein